MAGMAPTPRGHGASERAQRTPVGVRYLNRGLDIAYQPIVHLGSGAILAYEALARPRHPDAADPLDFFAALERGGMRLAGERAALLAAVGGVRGRLSRVKLFLNASPSTLTDPDFDLDELLELALAHDLSPRDLVIEVTESEAIADLDALVERTRRLREQGIMLAVDDAGAGHASFRVITRLRPSFIKVDRDLVSGIDVDAARHAFLDALVRFTRQIGSRLVAEGIETEGELARLAGLGVDAGQGFYLAPPRIDELVLPSRSSRRTIAASAQRLALGAAQVTAGELARPATSIDGSMTVREAYERFTGDPELGLLLLAGAGEGFAGQISRRSLQRRLSVPGGWEEQADLAVEQLADPHPLAVAAGSSLVDVAATIGSRPQHDLLDDVVVTAAGGAVLGVLSVRDVLRGLAHVGHHDLQAVHPLSGLRGTRWIDEELTRRLHAGEAVTALFVDLDEFRHLNKIGGFGAGDEVIRMLARCLSGVVAGVEDAALAHAGADDFVVLVGPALHEELVGELIRSVEIEVVPEARSLLGLPLSGSVRLSLSVAAVDLAGAPPHGQAALDWARTLLAPLSRTAKDHQDHACVHRSGDTLALSTWTHTPAPSRRINVGLVEPALVLRTLALLDEAWATWWDDPGKRVDVPEGFLDSRTAVERMRKGYGRSLRSRAEQALRDGAGATDVLLEGDEVELLGLLDRVALVLRSTHPARRPPVPPELALLDRLLRKRNRTLTREDRVSRLPAG